MQRSSATTFHGVGIAGRLPLAGRQPGPRRLCWRRSVRAAVREGYKGFRSGYRGPSSLSARPRGQYAPNRRPCCSAPPRPATADPTRHGMGLPGFAAHYGGRPAMTTIVVDGTKGGRVFDGVGAVSGGGGNSVQLIGYPAQQRSDILDYLFKPGAGAALHILKVEIGGDANSSAGAEPSHEHSRGVVNSNGGYEWWLMEAAKARNPAIKLCALPWAAPGWIGGGHFWCQDMIGYLVGWLGVAAQHGLTIDYIGGWNEQPACDTGWFKNLRAALDSAGYNSTAIVAADQAPWSKGSYD